MISTLAAPGYSFIRKIVVTGGAQKYEKIDDKLFASDYVPYALGALESFIAPLVDIGDISVFSGILPPQIVKVIQYLIEQISSMSDEDGDYVQSAIDLKDGSKNRNRVIEALIKANDNQAVN